MEEAPLCEVAEAATPGVLEKQLAEVEDFRRQLHELADRKADLLIQHITHGQKNDGLRRLPLSAPHSVFKGKKPVAVVLPDGTEIMTTTWRRAAAAIMRDCNADKVRHDRLMYLRGKVSGKLRPILSMSPEQMDAPLKIDERLYLESKYDTETLLTVLTKRVLDVVDYDYRRVTLQYRDPHQELSTQAAPERPEEEPSGSGMQMQM